MRIQLPHLPPAVVQQLQGANAALAEAKAIPQPTAAERESLALSIHLAKVAELVYEKDFQCVKERLTEDGCKEVTEFDVAFTQAVGYVRQGHRCLVFRGTLGTADIVTDLLCFYYGTPPRHLGFHMGWIFVRRQVREWLQSTASAQSGIFLAGHSLGAALAVVAAFDLQRKGIRIEQVFTFGCPRVGSYEFWKRYDEAGLNTKTIRFEHGQDGVCLIPPPLLYAHVGDVKLVVTPVDPKGNLGIVPFVPAAIAGTPQMTPALWLIAFAAIATSSNGIIIAVQHLSANWDKFRNMFKNSGGIALQGAAATGQSNSPGLEKLMRWIEPENTPVGLKNPILGYALFVPVLVVVHYLFSFRAASASLSSLILKWPWLYWSATAVEGVVVQQICYAALIRFPALLRLLLSILLTGFVFWRFPVTQIEAVGVPLLLVCIGMVLLIVYRLGGGLPDHFSVHYVKALAALGRPEVQPNSGAQPAQAAPHYSPEFEAHLRVLEEIGRDPVQSAAWDKAIKQILEQSH